MKRIKFVVSDGMDDKQLHFAVHGEGKVGKTSLVKTLPCTDSSKILYIGVDPGEVALRGMNLTRAIIPNNSWTAEDLFDLIDQILPVAHTLEWIVVDGMDEIGKRILLSKKDVSRDGRRVWTEANEAMDLWIKMIRDIDGPQKLFITHTAEKNDDGKFIYYPDMPGNEMKNAFNEYFDVIMCMRMIPDDEGGGYIRVLQTSREVDPQYRVGDRTGCLNPFEAPDISAIIDKIEGSLPNLRKVDLGKVLRANITLLAKSNKKVFESVSKKLKELGKKDLTELTQGQLESLLDLGKEVKQ